MFGKKIMEFQPELDHKLLDTLGLDAQKITFHHKKIQQVLLGQYSNTLPVVDVCSIENKSIVSADCVQILLQDINKIEIFNNLSLDEQLVWILTHVITCIPAAGAGSRYWQGASNEIKNGKQNSPKALFEVTAEKDTFLQIKVLEHQAIFKTTQNVVIAPKNYTNEFSQHIQNACQKYQIPQNSKPQFLILEQDENLSTIRFNLDGTPYLTHAQQYSSVPAGHGELLHLFSDINASFKDSRAIHLRNIDNIIGTSKEQQCKLENLAHMYALLQKIFDYLRSLVQECLSNPAQKKDMITNNALLNSAVKFLSDCSQNHSIVKLLQEIQVHPDKSLQQLFVQLQKPLSVFGMVKKESDDQGGGPVFAKLPNGHIVQICLEMSHVTESDKEEYFGQNGKLKYFNPVLVFFENKNADGKETNFKELFDENFWLLSKRKFEEQDVCYHETVLYELIGNSEKTNLFFIEVPRSLFRPHKYFKDSEGKTRKEYGI